MKPLRIAQLSNEILEETKGRIENEINRRKQIQLNAQKRKEEEEKKKQKETKEYIIKFLQREDVIIDTYTQNAYHREDDNLYYFSFPHSFTIEGKIIRK